MTIFHETQISLSKKVTLHFLNIENYSHDLVKLIEDEIGFIRNGPLNDEDLKDVKKRIKIWIDKKGKEERAKNGFIAEFICHLYLRYIKFEQYSLFKNLEENGPKKGFDGLYLLNNEVWIVESKSTVNNKKSHKSKINEAYKDIKTKLESSEEDKVNDPWENAKNHIQITNPNKSLSENVKKLSSDFINNRKHKIKEFNIIPCSTIYLNDNWEIIDIKDLENKFKIEAKKIEAKKINIICINKKSIDDFVNYINS
ncbi:hypothetical protein [Chryseobacterium sp. JM1]|uniref:hypothetical protein n=1 Tax=Chryseobacterium sp. JM1 TaxID=1233950 RepID=UPI0004E6D0BF|nr:hypothetical protein [Chryseobacterium sp. JM1]KFF21043.1 hypothetical protein IW22_12145 [Chryseobacterium sp. JM1]